MDHLGIERFSVVGMCIGGAFIMELLAEVPERIAAAVAFQPIGLDGNRTEFRGMFDQWREGIGADHPEATDADWEGCWSNLFGGDQLLWSVPDGFLPTVQTPLLVLQGNDPYHPKVASQRLAAEVPGATLVERWKDPADQPDRPRRRRPLLGRARLTTRAVGADQLDRGRRRTATSRTPATTIPAPTATRGTASPLPVAGSCVAGTARGAALGTAAVSGWTSTPSTVGVVVVSGAVVGGTVSGRAVVGGTVSGGAVVGASVGGGAVVGAVSGVGVGVITQLVSGSTETERWPCSNPSLHVTEYFRVDGSDRVNDTDVDPLAGIDEEPLAAPEKLTTASRL